MASKKPPIPIENIFHMLAYAWDCLPELGIIRVNELNVHDVPNLCADVLCRGVERLFKIGFDKVYTDRRELTDNPRGRIDFKDSLKHLHEGVPRLVCEHSELNRDTLPNRIIYSTLRHMQSNPEVGYSYADQSGKTRRISKIQVNITRLLAGFSGITPVDLTKAFQQRPRVAHNANFYHFLLQICRFYIDNTLMRNAAGRRMFSEFDVRNEHKMRNLFEQFIRNFYYRRQREFTCIPGRSHLNIESRFRNIENGYDPLPNMRADAVLVSDHKIIIIECKFTNQGLTLRRGDVGYSPKREHVYQLDAYIQNYQQRDEKNRNIEGILLYPTINENVKHTGRYAANDSPECSPTQSLSVKTVNLADSWEAIEQQLLNMVNSDEPLKEVLPA